MSLYTLLGESPPIYGADKKRARAVRKELRHRSPPQCHSKKLLMSLQGLGPKVPDGKQVQHPGARMQRTRFPTI